MKHRIGKNGRAYSGNKGAGIFFTDGESVLLLKRSGESDEPNTWSLPGGKSKKGESTINTAVRETKEETGLEHVPGRRVEALESQDGYHQFTTFIFRIERPFENVHISHEHDDWSWFPLAELSEVDLHPKFREDLPRFLGVIRRKMAHTFQEWVVLRGLVE